MKIIIKAKYGSKFQKSFWEKALWDFLCVWREHMEMKHKKNKAKIEMYRLKND